MLACIQLFYVFVKEIHEFDDELGLIFCPRIFQKMYMNFVGEMTKTFTIFTELDASEIDL